MSPTRRVVPTSARASSDPPSGRSTAAVTRTGRGRRSNRSRRSGSYRRVVTAGDVAIGLGLVVGAPAARMTGRAFRTAEQVGNRLGAAIFDSLPASQQSILRGQTEALAQSGRDARVETVDALVGTVVAEVMSSDVVRAAMVSAVGQAMDEVVDAAMPSVVEQLRHEIAPVRLEEMVRSSVERIVPEVIERDLSNAIAVAVALPGRTARGIARLPSSVLRPVVSDPGYDE